jgi:hypothetical protein
MALASRSSVLFSIFSFLSLIAIEVHGFRGAPWCKSVPGSLTWPSDALWAQLNTTIGGQLLQPVPPGAVCHPGHANYNATNCLFVQYEWSNEYFHQRDPVSVEWNNWNNDSCLPDPGVPCSSAGYPLYVINATTVEHVKAGIDFGKLYLLMPDLQLNC